MAVKVNYIVAKNSPNLYSAAKAANLPADQVGQLEQFSWTVEKNKNLSKLPADKAREEYNALAPEVQNKLKYLFPKADYMLAAPDTSDYAIGALKTVGKVVASPLIGIFKVAGVWNRLVNTPYLLARQAAQGENPFTVESFTDAWDGRRIFDQGDLDKAVNYFGNEKVEVAKGLIAGKTPGEIIKASGGEVNNKLLAAIEEAYNNPEEFQKVLDGVKYAQVSPGRDIARLVGSKSSALSGTIDFIYQIAVDPLTWATGGLSKSALAGTRLKETIERVGPRAGVAEVFADEASGVRKLWDEQLGPKVADLKKATRETRPAIINDIKANHPAFNSDAAIKLLEDNNIVTAAKAQEYFSSAEKVPLFVAGRVDGVQYFRNGIATANSHRRLGTGFSKFVDKVLNPATYGTAEETLKKTDDIWDSLLKNAPGSGAPLPEATDIKKFHDGLTKGQKIKAGISKQVSRSPQGMVIKLGDDAVETANAFRLNARQVLPKDMADFMTERFITSTASEQIGIMKAIDYAIIERYGITGHPGGKELAQEILDVKYGKAGATDVAAEMPVRADVAAIVGKDNVVYRDGQAFMKTGSIVQPFQETYALSSLDLFGLSQLSYELKSKKNLLMAVGGATQSSVATQVVNTWSLFTLIPRLGIRSAIDETMMYLLTAPAKNIMELFKGKGMSAGNISSAYSGSKSGERIRQLMARKLGLRNPVDALDDEMRNAALVKYAEDNGLDAAELTSQQRKWAQAMAAVDIYNGKTINKLDDDEANYLVQALALNSQYLGAATRSISSASNITGKQVPEVAEQFLDRNQFDNLMKSLRDNYEAGKGPRVEVGLKGKEVDVLTLERDQILNGMGANVIHFENFIKRFYGNRKSIKGTNENYNFNPGQAFLDNNALRDTNDWYRARNALLRKVGIERNVEGVFDDVTQQAMDELDAKFLFSVRDKKALSNFVEGRQRTSDLRVQGKDDIQIARTLVEEVLTDMYRYFHGDSNKYNQKLVDTLNEKHATLTENGTKFVANSWSEAAKKLSSDEFFDLTKDFMPTGKMYTSLEIEGLDDFGTAYQRLGNNLMEVMDRQVTGIIRQPATMVTYLKLRKFYSKAEKEYADDLFRQNIAELEASNKVINPDAIRAAANTQSQKYFAEVSVQQAADEILKFVDNPTIRSNFAVSARNVGRYYRATEDFWRRILRMKDVSPRVLYRTRLAHVGLDAAGGIYEDQNGDPYVMMPMDDIIFKTVDSVVRAVTPGESGFSQPMFNEFTLKLKLANPSFTPDAGLPTLSGPIGALSVIAMKNILGQVGGATGEKVGQELDNYALGGIGDNIDVVRAIVPSTLTKLWSILPQNEKSRQEATAAMQAIAYNASQGYMLDPNATEEEKFNYLKNIRLSAHNIIVMRSVLGLISPVAPTMQESIGVPDYLKEVGITGLRPEFFDILNAVTEKYKGDIQDPYELAVSTFIGQNRGKLIYNVSRDDKKTNVVINKTKQLKDWAISNKDNIKTYGEAAFIFAPNTGDFDIGTYAWLEGAGLIGDKDLETYYRDVLVAKDKQSYYDIAKDEKAFLASSGDPQARAAIIKSSTAKRNALKASNPLLEPALTAGGNEVGTELASFSSIEQIIIDGNIKVDAGTKQRLAMITSRIRQFISIANDPSKRELANFSELKRDEKEDIKALIEQLQVSDPIVKEANRAVFKAILEYYSRDSYTAGKRQ